MLTDVTLKQQLDPILTMIATMNGQQIHPTWMERGLYHVGDWGFEHICFEKLEPYPDLRQPLENLVCYGVCDGHRQFLSTPVGKFVSNSPRRFVVALGRVTRDSQSEEGGWRWHKWGPYIGLQTPTAEYLYDEPDISEIWTYHVYEVLS